MSPGPSTRPKPPSPGSLKPKPSVPTKPRKQDNVGGSSSSSSTAEAWPQNAATVYENLEIAKNASTRNSWTQMQWYEALAHNIPGCLCSTALKLKFLNEWNRKRTRPEARVVAPVSKRCQEKIPGCILRKNRATSIFGQTRFCRSLLARTPMLFSLTH